MKKEQNENWFSKCIFVLSIISLIITIAFCWTGIGSMVSMALSGIILIINIYKDMHNEFDANLKKSMIVASIAFILSGTIIFGNLILLYISFLNL